MKFKYHIRFTTPRGVYLTDVMETDTPAQAVEYFKRNVERLSATGNGTWQLALNGGDILFTITSEIARNSVMEMLSAEGLALERDKEQHQTEISNRDLAH